MRHMTILTSAKMSVRVDGCLCVCVRACVRASVRAWMPVCMRVCVRECVRVCLGVCVRAYAGSVAHLGFFLDARFSQYMYAYGIYIALLVLSRRTEQMPFRPENPVASLRSKHHNLFGWV